jgi:predicted nucleic-acid-binding protein
MQKSKSGSLDTNALLRYVLDDIPTQTAYVESLIHKSEKLEVADIAVFEMVYVLERVYKMSRGKVEENVLVIIRHPKINCNRKLFELTLPIYRTHQKLSIVDCALTQYATLNKSTPLYTFDKELAKKCPDTAKLIE